MNESERVLEEITVLRARLGSGEALGKLAAKYHRRLLYYIRRLVDGEDAARDVAQSVWLEVALGIGGLREPGAFRAWLYRIARNRAALVVRAEIRERKLLEDAAEDAAPEAIVEDPLPMGEPERVHRALMAIRREHREVLALQYLENMTYAEIAEVTGVPIGTVRSRLHHAKAAMRKQLTETEP